MERAKKQPRELSPRGLTLVLMTMIGWEREYIFSKMLPFPAYAWAKERYPNAPAVIKSKLVLENCLDLLDIGWFPLIRET